MTTFLQIQNEVQYHIRQRTDLITYVKSKINQAVLDVMLLVKPPEFFSTVTITTTTQTPDYDILATSDVLAVLGATLLNTNIDSNDRRLIRGNWREFDAMDQDFTDSNNIGRPRKYFRYANEIILYNKVPDDNDGNNWSIQVRMLLRPTVLSADADTFPLNAEWEEPTVLRAAYKLFTLTGDRERREETMALFQESINFVLDNSKDIENREDRDARMIQGSHQHRPSSGMGRH